MTFRGCVFLLIAATLVAATAAPARAQTDQDPAVFRPAEPDFLLVNLPTTLPLPTLKGTFRISHRFVRPLNEGDFGDWIESGFGIDGGARIGLEFRMGIMRNLQAGIYRTSDRTIEFFGSYDVLHQSRGMPLAVSAWASIEGADNFTDEGKTPTIGAVIARRFGDVAALYAEPLWVNNSNPLPSELVDHNSTMMVGLGARVRVRPSVYVVAEATPRSQYAPGSTPMSFAVEKHVGGHMFQLNFSNFVGSTMGQIAGGGHDPNDWYMGFNISRKFF